MTEAFVTSPWPGIALWSLLYVGDYAMTILTARLYGTQDKLRFEGSFELNPAFQKDVDALRRVSPKFLVALFGVNLLLWIQWRVVGTSPAFSHYYLLILGMLVSVQLAIHIRHLRNYFMFRTALGDDGIRGHMEYPRAVILRLSAVEIGAFSGLYLVLFLVTGSWFVLGGSITCAVLAWKHRRFERAHLRTLARAAQQADAPDEVHAPVNG